MGAGHPRLEGPHISADKPFVKYAQVASAEVIFPSSTTMSQ